MTSQWTPEAIRALGATTDLPTLGSIFGLGRWRSYQMAHTGEWEQAGIHIIAIGARYRVTVQSILAVLGHGGTAGTEAASKQLARDQTSPSNGATGVAPRDEAARGRSEPPGRTAPRNAPAVP